MSTDARKPVLIVIAGPNRSGKTSVTSKILQHEWMEDSVYINPDIVAQEKFGDWNSMDAIKNAVIYCEEWREKCLAERKSLIFETVLSAKDKIRLTAPICMTTPLMMPNSNCSSAFPTASSRKDM